LDRELSSLCLGFGSAEVLMIVGGWRKSFKLRGEER
jgi:hypothetical protein